MRHLSYILCCFFVGLSAQSHAQNQSPIEERSIALINLYNYSKTLYLTQGPLAFWESFAFDTTKDERSVLLQATRGMPELPVITRLKDTSILFQNRDKSVKVFIKDFEKQIVLINSREIKIPEQSEMKLLLDLVNKNLPKAKYSFLESLLKRFSLIPEANASIGALFASIGAVISGFFSGIFKKKSKANPNQIGPSSRSNRNLHNESPTPTANPTPSPAPAEAASIPSPPSVPMNEEQMSLIEKLSIPPLNKPMGSACTIVFTRHGEKNSHSKYQELTNNGHKQAAALSVALGNFEKNYGNFDIVLHSNEKRSIETSSHIEKDRPNTPGGDAEIQKALRECEGDCSSKAKSLIQLLKDKKYCKRKPNGSPTMIFITGHGSLGQSMLSQMLPGEKISHPDCARPYVLTSNDGDKFELLHKPSYKTPLCTN